MKEPMKKRIMKLKNKYQGEKGGVTLFVLIAMLFFLMVGIIILFSNFNAGTSQKKDIEKIKSEYNTSVTDSELDQVYAKEKEKLAGNLLISVTNNKGEVYQNNTWLNGTQVDLLPLTVNVTWPEGLSNSDKKLELTRINYTDGASNPQETRIEIKENTIYLNGQTSPLLVYKVGEINKINDDCDFKIKATANGQTAELEIKVDISNPVVNVQTTGDGIIWQLPGEERTGRIDATITANDKWTQNGENNLDKVQYIVNQTIGTPAANADWQDYTGEISKELSAGEGEYYVHARAIDKAGNTTYVDDSTPYAVKNANYEVTTGTTVDYAETLQEAISKSSTTTVSTIKALSTYTDNSYKTTTTTGVEVDRNVIIDLAGKTITLTNPLTNNGTLEIKSTQENGTITRNGNVINNNNNTSSLTVSSGAITSISGYGINNNANGNVSVTGGNVSSQSSIGIKNNSAGTINISGGSISGTNGVYNETNGTINVSNGTITATTAHGIRGYIGTVNVTGGTINGKTYGVSVTQDDNNNAGSLVMAGGSTISEGFGLYAGGSASITMGTNDSTVSKDTPSVESTSTSGDYYGISRASSATFNFYDGKIIGYDKHSLNRDVSNKPEGYQVVKRTIEGREIAVLEKEVKVTFNKNAEDATCTETERNVLTNVEYQYNATTGENQTLPIPTRTGYTFQGWNGKNLFDESKYTRLEDYDSYNNRYYWATIQLKQNTTYKVSVKRYNNYDGKTGCLILAKVKSPGQDGYWTAISHISSPDTSNSNFQYTTSEDGKIYIGYYNCTQADLNTIWANTDVQIEEGTTVTPYEPYYITDNTKVVQEFTHTLKAKWEPISYTVTADANGGTIASTEGWTGTGASATKSVTYDSAYSTLPTPTRVGHTFDGWYLENTFINKVEESTIVNTADEHTIYAKWTPITYNITYNMDGGTNNASNPATYTIETPTINLKTPTKSGNTFFGWSVNEGENKLGSIERQDSNVTINNGTYTFTNETEGNRYTATKLQLWHSTQGFIKEISDKSANGKRYGIYDHKLDSGTYRIQFATQSNKKDASVFYNVTLEQGKKYYYEWENTKSTEQEYVAKNLKFVEATGNKAVSIPQGSTGDKEFTAYWYANSYTYREYTATFDVNGGNELAEADRTRTLQYGTPLGTLPQPTRTGYDFVGWYTNSTSGTQISAETKMGGANIRYYAHWTAKQYTLTANANGGTIDSSTGWTGTGASATKSVTYDSEYGTLPTVTKKGYTLKGWNGKNLFNVENVVQNYYIKRSDGQPVEWNDVNTPWNCSDYIEIEGGKTYTFNPNSTAGNYDTGHALYDENKNFISSVATGQQTITTPANARYIRVSYRRSNSSDIQLEEGDTATQYEPYYLETTTPVTTAKNHTIKAIWEVNQYTLTVDPNGGTWNGKTTATTITQNYDTTYNVANNPTRTGYIFGGWRLVNGSDSAIDIEPDGNISYLDGSTLVNQYKITAANSDKPSVYNNSNNGTVTHTIKQDSTSSTGYSLEIKTNGTATPEGGGFVNATNSVAGTFYYHKIVAKVPQNCTLKIHSNVTGIGYNTYWLTSNQGTGEWKTYIYAQYTGFNSPLGNFGHVSINAPDNTNVTWWLQESSMYRKATNLTELQSTSVNYRFIDENQKLRAIWTKNGARLGFDAQGGTYGNGTIGNNYTARFLDLFYDTQYSNQKRAPYYISDSDFAIYKKGYTFDGWYRGRTGGTKIFDKNGKLVPNISGYTDANYTWLYYTNSFTIYAHWIPNTYTVTANANGGTIASSTGWTGTGNEATKDVTYDSAYGTLPTVSKTGYTFKGWYKEEAYTNKIEESTIVNTASNHTIYAKWEADTYTVTANANGGTIASSIGWTGTGNSATKDVTYDSAYGELPTATKTGYTLKGWNGKNLLNIDEATVRNMFNGTYGVNARVENDRIILSGTNNKTDKNYSLIIWKTDLPQLEVGKTYNLSVSENLENVYVQLNYINTSGEDELLVKTSNSGVVTIPNDYTKTNYLFIGINKNATTVNYNFTVQLEESSTATAYEPYYITKDTKVVQDQDHTLKAIWQATPYFVTLEANGGTVAVPSVPVVYDSPYGELPTPIKDGFEFVGWYKEDTFQNKVTADTIVKTASNHSLYAKWGIGAGLYDENDNLIKSWSELEVLGVTKEAIETDYTYNSFRSNTGSLYNLFKNNNLSGKLVLPNTITKIGDYALITDNGLTSIIIPEGVTSIGEYAFFDYFTSGTLRSVTIPASVRSIDNQAFYGCSGLTSINVDSNNSKYDSRNNCNAIIETSSNALMVGCNNTVIPDTVTSIRQYAFYGCSGLTSITIPASVRSINNQAFYGCSGLTSINVDSNNSRYDSRNNCNAIISISTNTLITGCKNTVIPDTVRSIGQYAFYGCSGLTSITIPNSVISIGQYAFYGCSGLTSITIPNNVTSIGQYAFYRCSGLTSIIIPNSVTTIPYNAFAYCESLTSVTIPNSVTSIGQYAFYGCSGLTSITIPNNVTSIGQYAFCGCSGLTSITIPNNVTSIPYNAFAYCESLTSVTIPNSVTSIGQYAFYGCSGLTSITMPNSITSIEESAFSGCISLTSITIPDSVTSIGRQAFYECSNLANVTFNNPNGWFVSTSSTATSGTNLTLTSTAQNATYLKSTYPNYYWKRNP